MPRTVVTPEIIEEINKLYKYGYNMKSIAEKLGIGHSTVNFYVKNPRKRGTVADTKKSIAKKEESKSKTYCNSRVNLFSIGQKLVIETADNIDLRKGKKVIKGRVIFSNDNHFTVLKEKNGKKLYREDFMYCLVLSNAIQVREV